jgi:hypothetical protein
MKSIKYEGREGIFEYHGGIWYKLHEGKREEIHDVAFYEPNLGVIQLDLFKRNNITLEQFMKGTDPSNSTDEKGQLYILYKSKCKRRVLRTSELTRIITELD